MRSSLCYSRGYYTLILPNVLIGQNAGLPDIMGDVQMGGINYWGYAVKGAFYKSPDATSYKIYIDNADGKIGNTLFDASLGETKIDGTLKTASEYHVFGKSDTVLPQYLVLRYWRRTS